MPELFNMIIESWQFWAYVASCLLCLFVAVSEDIFYDDGSFFAELATVLSGGFVVWLFILTPIYLFKAVVP